MKYFSKKMLTIGAGLFTSLTILGVSLGVVGGVVQRSQAPIAVLLSSRNNPFFQQVADGIDIGAREFGYTVQYFDSDNSTEKEATHIQSIIAGGFKMVLFNDVNETSGVEAVKQLNRANIPVIAVDHVLVPEELKAKDNNVYQIDDNFHVIANIASDNFQAGEILAVYASQVLKIPFSTRTFTMYGIPGTASSDQRMRGFTRKIKSSSSADGNYKLRAVGFGIGADNDPAFGVQTDDNRSKAFTAISGNFPKYFSTNATEFSPILFGTNDEVAIGGINAIKSSGGANLLAGSTPWTNSNDKKVWVFGVDYTADALIAVKNNEQSATVRQDTHLMGYLSMDIASYYLDPQLYGEITKYGDVDRFKRYNDTTFDYWSKRYPDRFALDIEPETKMQPGYYFKLNTSLTYWDAATNDYKNVGQVKTSDGVSSLKDLGPAGQLNPSDTPGQPEKITFSN